MAIEKLGRHDIPLTEIETGTRLRRVTEAGVAQLVASIGALGHMTDPVQVRQISGKAGAPARRVLMAGGHRLEAARRLGWDTIPAQVWRCSDDEALLFEIDDNLASRELTALERAWFMARRKEAYLRLHPGTGHGGDRKSAGRKGNDQNEMISFCSATAEQHGRSVRWAEIYVTVGERLYPDERRRIETLPIAGKLTELLALSKLPPEDRPAVIDALAAGAKSVRAALARVAGTDRLPVSDGEAKLRRALDAFERLPRRERRLFLRTIAGFDPEMFREELQQVLSEALAAEAPAA
jgi:ParB family chromosome partitioning protein